MTGEEELALFAVQAVQQAATELHIPANVLAERLGNGHLYDLISGARMILTESPGDFVYVIRESEMEGWDGPRVTNWNAGVMAIESAIQAIAPEGEKTE